MKNENYDLTIIGAGPGGYLSALKAAQMGAKVAVIEKHLLGGTCLNYGCIPSKALLASAMLKHEIEHADAWGIEVSGKAKVAWDKIQARKDKVLKTLRGGIKGLFKARGVDLYEGTGRFVDRNRLQVTGEDGSIRQIDTKKTIIAVGSVPFRIPGWPDDPEFVCTSDESLHWDELPKKLLIVGGGVIGCEFACMMQALGVEVTVVEMMPALLPGLDSDIAAELHKIFTKRGIAIHTDTRVEGVKVNKKSVTAELSTGDKLNVDKVLVSIGRKPATDDLGLENVGIETDRGFIRVNDKMQTAAQDIYCIGDANGRCLLAHAASAHGMVAVRNALGHDETFDLNIPNAVYTFPEISSVGITEQQAAEKGLPYAVGTFPIGHLGKAMAAGHTEGFVKVIRHRETARCLGVHLIGHNVTECIGTLPGLLDRNATVEQIAETVVAHPTIAESIKEAAEDALYAALHLPPRKVLQAHVGDGR